jgi:Protein of unknown function (DUF3224)
MTTATGTFQVTSQEEDVYDQTDAGLRLARARGTQEFAGDIAGQGSVEWLVCYSPPGGRFVGLQRIEGTLGGRRGSLIIEATAEFDGTRSRGWWRVLPDTGGGELQGITGEGSFEASAQSASYRLEYELG